MFGSPRSVHCILKSETFTIFGVVETTKYKDAVFVWDDIDLATNKNGPSYSPEEQLGELNWTLNSEQAFPHQEKCLIHKRNASLVVIDGHDQVIVCVIIETHSNINGKLMQTMMQSTN